MKAATTKKALSYSSDSIDMLAGLDGIRNSPGVYIGDTGINGLWLLSREGLDNALDEYLAGRNNAAWFHIDSDGSYWVIDKGTGIPQGVKSVSVNVNGKAVTNKIPTMQAVFGELNTSGKFRAEAYKTSIGCFVGETELRLLSGKTVTFTNLYTRWLKNKKPIPIMTWDTKKDQVAYSNISHVQLTKHTKHLVDVELSSGKVTRCTPNHPFYVRSNSGRIKKVFAEDLKPGMSLVSAKMSYTWDGYYSSSDLCRNQEVAQTRQHRSVYQFYNPDVDMTDKIVHHKNRRRDDNRISNLELLSIKDHAIEHSEEKSLPEALDFIANYNHSVKSVTHVKLKQELPVYDITVDNTHTFFVNDVLVANSHGMGIKAANATSEYFDVVSNFKGKWYSVGFKAGKLTSAVKECKAPKDPKGKLLGSGTMIHFKPDAKIFSVKSFPINMAYEWARTMSYLNPNFGILITTDKTRQAFISKKGPIEYVEHRVAELKVEMLPGPIFDFRNELADVVLTFTNHQSCDLKGFTNGLSNIEGGTHVDVAVDGMFNGLCQHLIKAGKEKMFRIKLKTGVKNVFTKANFKEGLVGMINAKLHKAVYSSQAKAKLTDSRMSKELVKTIANSSEEFFNKNKKLAITIAERAAKLNSLMADFAKSKSLMKDLNTLRTKGMPVKYSPYARSSKLEDRELLIVEGDSAGGTVKAGKFPYQAVLPLKGKVANAIKMKGDKALESEEITHILGALGFDPRAVDPYSKLNVSKVILLADGDPDGQHINVLLLALFYKYLPKLFEMGMVYVSITPEFYCNYKGKICFGQTQSDVVNKMKSSGVPATTPIHHIKGWGEISGQLMRMLALDPDTRTLLRINALSDEDKAFQLLMNDDTAYRKELLGIK